MIVYRYRYYNPLLSPPLSDDLDISSDNLDEFHGYDSDLNGMEEGLSFSPDSIIEENKVEESKDHHLAFMATFEDTKMGKLRPPMNMT